MVINLNIEIELCRVMKRASKRDEVPLPNSSPSPFQERGIQGVRLDD
jgi:hypothetical protein